MTLRPFIVEHSRVPRLLSLVVEVEAITLWPFIFARGALSPQTRRHELIHWRQYAELWVLGFLVLYAWDWLRGLLVHRSGAVAYRRIRLEQEAYAHDDEPGYLEVRRPFAWRAYRVTAGEDGAGA